MKRFEEIPHTADWSYKAFGRDLRVLFENAALAMFTMEGAAPEDAETRTPDVTRTVAVHGIDQESLLVNWLNELLYLQDLKREAYFRFQIESLSPTELTARVFGIPNRHIDKLVKAATFHNLKIFQEDGQYQAVVVVDV